MKTFFKLYIFLCISSSYSQISTIELPKGEEKISIERLVPIISIYMDRDSNMYLEDKPVTIYELGKELKYIVNQIPNHFKWRLRVFLYIDKQITYQWIDRIKTEVASVGLKSLVYKTNTLNDSDIRSGLRWRNHYSYYSYSDSKEFKTLSEIAKEQQHNDSINKTNGFPPNIPPPPPPKRRWVYDFEERMYSNQKEIIQEILSQRKHTCITVTNNGILTPTGIITLDKEEQLLVLFKTNDVLLTHFDGDLKYETYLNTLRTFTSVYKKKGKSRHRLFILELSSEILSIHQKENIIICN